MNRVIDGKTVPVSAEEAAAFEAEKGTAELVRSPSLEDRVAALEAEVERLKGK